ncbi:MAG TPA: EamA family transporter [Candidatus Acidoferrum sp.]|nr:EamA family transporter [Candidatus Acidoferrum sp.]
MTKILIILVVAFTFEAFGVIALKQGLNEIGAQYTVRQGTLPVWQNVVRLVGNWFTNKNVLFGLLLETIFFVLLQYLIGQRDVSFVWPLTAISFILTTLAAQFLLHERVDFVRWSGVALIVIGAAFISYSEHQKEKAPLPVEASQPAILPQ